MNRLTGIVILSLLTGYFNTADAISSSWSGHVAAEATGYVNSPQYDGQERNDFSISLQPEFYQELTSNSSLTIELFGRYDQADTRRSHFDIRELNYLYAKNIWEFRVGVSKVFWGTTEFIHLVDVINQTDLVESMLGEDKLGQPMVHLAVISDFGVIDLFVLPGFRERTFAGKGGRLRSPLLVEFDDVQFEHADAERHVDVAARFSGSNGPMDFGISHFIGTNREPEFLFDINQGGNQILIPYYRQINQTGVDLQLVAGEWLINAESIYRTNENESFFAGVGGFEYSFYGIAGSSLDLTMIGLFAYDERGQEKTAFQSDAMLGFRIGLNDVSDTQLLGGISRDLESDGTFFQMEIERRLGSSWKAHLESLFFINQSDEDVMHYFSDDDYLRIMLEYYF
jgi:hypothetical protein